jgi:hypothetical protein
MNPIRIIRGSIILCSGIPDDFSADSSLNSPMFPKVIRDARRIPSGSAVGTNVSAKWYNSSLSILKSSPFPASSSTYIHRNCKRRMISTIKNVNIRGPINDFNKKLSTFFTCLNHLKCKTTRFLSKITFSKCSIFNSAVLSVDFSWNISAIPVHVHCLIFSSLLFFVPLCVPLPLRGTSCVSFLILFD